MKSRRVRCDLCGRMLGNAGFLSRHRPACLKRRNLVSARLQAKTPLAGAFLKPGRPDWVHEWIEIVGEEEVKKLMKGSLTAARLRIEHAVKTLT